jgi:hypothetical protein
MVKNPPSSQLRQKSKQQLLENIQQEHFDPANIDPRNPSDIELLIEHIQAKVESEINLLNAEKENALNKLKHDFSSNMIKMARSTRQMTISEFNTLSQCDIVDMVRSSMVRMESSLQSAHEYGMETPAHTRRNKRDIATAPRTVRRGEQVLSRNGSPIELCEEGTLVATVSKTRREASLEIHVGQGLFINIDDAQGIEAASPGQKEMARVQLEELRNKIDILLMHKSLVLDRNN